jgi:hypothetical protein
MFYLPIIVTIANLQTMILNQSNFDLKSGKITESITPIPVENIRFRKNIATNIKYEKSILYSLEDLNRENDRTVL